MDNRSIFISIIFVCCFYFFNLVTGQALLELLKVKTNKALSTITGLILLFAMTEIMCIPFMLFRGEFKVLFILFCTVELLTFILSSIYLFWYKNDYSILKFDYKKSISIWVLLIIVFVLVQTLVPTFFSRHDGDDAFYIAIATSIQQTGKVFANNPSIGLNKFPFPTNYSFTSFEVLVTIFSQILNFDPVTVFHSLMPLSMIPLSYISNYAFALALFPKKKNKAIYFTLFVAVLTFFNGFTGCLPSSVILLRPWMGKSVMIAVLFPVFIAYFIYFYRSTKRDPYFFLLGMSLIAAACASSTGLYLFPIEYFLLFMCFLLIKRFPLKETFVLLVKAFLSVVPMLIILGWFYINLKNGNELEIISEFETEKDWLGELDYIVNSNWTFLIIYILSFVYFIFFGNEIERLLFVILPVALLLTFLNPLLHQFVGRNLTSLPTYWRLFWLILYYPSIITCAMSAYKEIDSKYLKVVGLLPIIALCNPYFLSLSDWKYTGVENSKKIPNYVFEAIDTIKDNTNTDNPNDLYLLSLPAYNIFVRQCTGEISLVMPRLNYVKEAFESINQESDFKYVRNLFKFDKDDIIRDYVETFNMEDINKLGISLIIATNERPELNQEFKLVMLPNKDYLYIKKGIYGQ